MSPQLSVIVVVYNMAREAPRTLYTLSAAYQDDIDPSQYEVIVVDNGSSPRLTESGADLGFAGNFDFLYLEDAPASPARAVNVGVERARGQHVGILIDGARMASPGLLNQTLAALNQPGEVVVSTLGFHLGPAMQTVSPSQGYCAAEEDRLLENIDWKNNGYALFDISVLAGSSQGGWFDALSESNALFLRRDFFLALGGFDERFDLPGGGLLNLDFYRLAREQEGVRTVKLLGEGTFHQIHGGIMANRPQDDVPREMEIYKEQYERIRGRPFVAHPQPEILFAKPTVNSRLGVRKSKQHSA